MTRASVRGHDTVTRLLHWATVAAVAVALPVGIAMTGEGFGSVSDALYVTHKGVGVVIGVLVATRLAWRIVAPSPPPLPASVAPLERRLARWTHAGLYGLLLLLAVSGYARTVAGGFPIELLDRLGVPPLVPEMPRVSRALSVVHSFAGYALVAAIALHVGAVARHAWVVGDEVAGRMWPPVAPGGGGDS